MIMTDTTQLNPKFAEATTPDVHADMFDGRPRVIVCTSELSAKFRAEARGLDTNDPDWEEKYEDALADDWELAQLEHDNSLRSGFQMTPVQAIALAKRLLEAVRHLDQATVADREYRPVWRSSDHPELNPEQDEELRGLFERLTGPNRA